MAAMVTSSRSCLPPSSPSLSPLSLLLLSPPSTPTHAHTQIHTAKINTMSDEEPVDQLPQIRKDCIKTCPGPLANYEACKDRIKGKENVSCEIWYYELHHCVDLCVAPKIFAVTKGG
mmetsp:Transcript_16240/g.45011  ORF Transcript_16240/g.45011 Transcript_16240/m.45011 type:complete len:117 (-) Transcript_16240:161-511(-)